MIKNKKDIDKFALLTELMDHFNLDADLRSYTDFLLQFIEEHFGFKKLTLKLISNSFNELIVVSTRGVSKKFVSFSATKLGVGISGKVALSGKPMVVEDIAENIITVPLAEVFEKEGIHSFLSIPIVTKNEVIGVINIYERDSRSINTRVANHLMTVTNFAGIFISLLLQKDDFKNKLGKLRQYNAALERLKNFHDLILESIPIGIVATDTKGYVVLMNRALEKMSLLSRKDCLGKRWFEIFGFEGELRKKLETSYRTSSMQLFPMINLPLKDGSVLPVEMKTDIIRDQSGRTIGVVAICSNIEEKKKIEQEIDKIERLVAFGKLASGITHEIRNPLAGISGVIQLLKKKLSGDVEIKNILDRIFVELERLNNVVEKLNGVVSSKKMSFDLYSITDIVEDCLFFIQEQLKSRGIRLAKGLQKSLDPVIIDRDAIYQVILNIVINAMNAMPEGGKLKVETVFLESLDALEPDIVWCHSGSITFSVPDKMGEAQFVAVIISDEGIGISQSILPKIFEPFFTTSDGGTGLGLYISARIVEQHHGMIGVRSKRGKGSVFFILIPAERERVIS